MELEELAEPSRLDEGCIPESEDSDPDWVDAYEQ
jgi:hypothetical protein